MYGTAGRIFGDRIFLTEVLEGRLSNEEFAFRQNLANRRARLAPQLSFTTFALRAYTALAKWKLFNNLAPGH